MFTTLTNLMNMQFELSSREAATCCGEVPARLHVDDRAVITGSCVFSRAVRGSPASRSIRSRDSHVTSIHKSQLQYCRTSANHLGVLTPRYATQ